MVMVRDCFHVVVACVRPTLGVNDEGVQQQQWYLQTLPKRQGGQQAQWPATAWSSHGSGQRTDKAQQTDVR